MSIAQTNCPPSDLDNCETFTVPTGFQVTLDAYPLCTFTAEFTITKCGDNVYYFSDLVLKANFNSASGLADCQAFQNDLNQASDQTAFFNQFLTEIFEDAADDFAEGLIMAGAPLGVDFSCPGNGPGSNAPITVNYARSSCQSVCFGVDTCTSTSDPVYGVANCGDVCCVTFKTYCLDDNDQRTGIITDGPNTEVTGLETCDDSPVNTSACQERGSCIVWGFTTSCGSEPACSDN